MTGRTLWLASVVAVGAALGWIGAASEQRPAAADDWRPAAKGAAAVEYRVSLPGERVGRKIYRVSLDGQECVIASSDARVDAISCEWGGQRP